LSNFSQKTAEIDLPGELLLPRQSHYNVKIARFMPRVEVVQKHNTSPRRIFIRGTNGKVRA
jgi:transformation/transcription domain-associated protein